MPSLKTQRIPNQVLFIFKFHPAKKRREKCSQSQSQLFLPGLIRGVEIIFSPFSNCRKIFFQLLLYVCLSQFQTVPGQNRHMQYKHTYTYVNYVYEMLTFLTFVQGRLG